MENNETMRQLVIYCAMNKPEKKLIMMWYCNEYDNKQILRSGHQQCNDAKSNTLEYLSSYRVLKPCQ